MTHKVTAAARAMQLLQHGEDAYHCPAGHGALRVWPDATSPTGLRLACTGCGHSVTVDQEMIELAVREPEPSEVDPAPLVQLPDGTAPRGLLDDGTVRTTGCVQVGNVPVSSGLFVALTALSATVPLTPVAPVLPAVATPLSYLVWKLCTKGVSASHAVNTQRVAAAEVVAGQQIRLYGTAGPVGVVSAVGADARGRIRLRMVGGAEVLRRPRQRVWRVDLRD